MGGEQRITVEGILQNADDEVLLLQRSEHESYPGEWQPPAGKIEYRESPWDAVAREVYEETGLAVSPVSPPDGLINTQAYTNEYETTDDSSNGLHTIIISYRVDPVEPYDPDDVMLSDEHQAYDWVHPDEAPERELVGSFQETVELLEPYNDGQ